MWKHLVSFKQMTTSNAACYRSCLYGDSVSFYALLKRYRTKEYALSNSGWTIMEAAERVFTVAKERIFNRESGKLLFD